MVKVIKIGGSLLGFPNELNNLCKLLLKNRSHQLLIVPGGGVFADVVRKYYKELNLSEITSHKMAIYSMDQYGLILKEFIGDYSVIISNIDNVEEDLKNDKVGILKATNINLQTKLIPRSWSVTSDSIAAFVSQKIDAEKLLLTKVVDGLFDKKTGKLLTQVCLSKFGTQVKQGIVDDYFAKVLALNKKPSYVVNGRYPHRIINILRGKNTVCTKIIPD